VNNNNNNKNKLYRVNTITAKEWFAGDVMIVVVHFAALLHLHVRVYEKIPSGDLDSSLNALEFMHWE
jgi:hypothetical protein